MMVFRNEVVVLGCLAVVCAGFWYGFETVRSENSFQALGSDSQKAWLYNVILAARLRDAYKRIQKQADPRFGSGSAFSDIFGSVEDESQYKSRLGFLTRRH